MNHKRGLPPEAAEPHTKEPVMEKGTTYVGLDVHKRSIAISVQWPGVVDQEGQKKGLIGRIFT